MSGFPPSDFRPRWRGPKPKYCPGSGRDGVARIPKEVDPRDYPHRQRKPLREALAIAELPRSAVRTVEDEIVVGIELRLPASPLIRIAKAAHGCALQGAPRSTSSAPSVAMQCSRGRA